MAELACTAICAVEILCSQEDFCGSATVQQRGELSNIRLLHQHICLSRGSLHKWGRRWLLLSQQACQILLDQPDTRSREIVTTQYLAIYCTQYLAICRVLQTGEGMYTRGENADKARPLVEWWRWTYTLIACVSATIVTTNTPVIVASWRA